MVRPAVRSISFWIFGVLCVLVGTYGLAPLLLGCGSPAQCMAGVAPPSATQVYVDVTRPCGGIAGARKDGSTNVVSVVNCWIGRYPAGATLHFPAGTYKWSTALSIATPGIVLAGDGEGNTTLDDTALTGDAITYTIGSYHCGIRDLSISASSPRSAGDTVLVKGGGYIWRNPSDNLGFLRIQNVWFKSQFNSVHLTDGTTSITDGMGNTHVDGAWETYIDNVSIQDTASGGVGLWQISNNGGEMYANDVFEWGAYPNATRGLAGVRIQATADSILHHVSSVFFATGLLVDPPSGSNVAVLMISESLWDSTSVRPVTIAPAAGSRCDEIEFTDNWFGQGVGGTIASVNLTGPFHSVTFNGGRIISNPGQIGIYATGAGGGKGVYVFGTKFIGGDYGFRATGSLTNFAVEHAIFEPWPAISTSAPAYGVFIEAGSDRYNVIGNFCEGTGATSCANANVWDAGGPNKVVANNL